MSTVQPSGFPTTIATATAETPPLFAKEAGIESAYQIGLPETTIADAISHVRKALQETTTPEEVRASDIWAALDYISGTDSISDMFMMGMFSIKVVIGNQNRMSEPDRPQLSAKGIAGSLIGRQQLEAFSLLYPEYFEDIGYADAFSSTREDWEGLALSSPHFAATAYIAGKVFAIDGVSRPN